MNVKRLTSALGLSTLFVAFIIAALLGAAPHSSVQARPAATLVGGVITQSTTWDLAGNPYVMNTSVIVTNGVTLTIEPGVIVQGTSHLVELRVLGTLNAIGTAAQPITVTTNDTGLGYNWLGLVVDGGTAQLRHTTVEYACGDIPAGGSSYTSNILVINNGLLDMADSTVQHCDYGGGTAEMMVRVIDARANIHATTFSDSQYYPVDIAGANSVITLTDNIITGNLYNRIRIEAGAFMNVDTTLYPQAVWEGYEFARYFNVPATRTLTLQPGVIVANVANAELRVYGQFNAIGTATQPITMTVASESAPYGWPGLLFDGPFAAGDLRYVTLEHAGSNYANVIADKCDAIDVRDVLTHEIRLENSRFQDFGGWCSDNGVYVENGRVAMSGTLFSNLGDSVADDFAIRVKGAGSVMTLTNNSISSTFANRILLEADALMGQDTTLVPQTGLQGYEFVAGFNVPATRTLTLAPGVIMQGPQNGELRVYGRLNAIGTLTQPITFTALASNNPGGWPGLLFDGAFASGDLQYVNVQAASSNYGNASGMCNSLEARNVLTHEVHLAYSQITDFGGWCDNSGLYAENSHVVVEDTVFASHPTAAGAALRVTGNSTVLVSRSQIESNSGRALQVEGDTAFVKVVNSTLIGNGLVGQPAGGVRNTGRATVILGGEADAGNAIFANQGFGAQQVNVSGTIAASYNWWGDATGPMHGSNPGGLGEDVSDRVVYTPWLTTTPVIPVFSSQYVHVFGPLSVSAGEAAIFSVQFHNVSTETLRDVAVAATLPRQAAYLDSSHGGQYWPERHQVVWKLGDVAPGQTLAPVLRLQYWWGLPAHLWMSFRAEAGARNLPTQFDLDEYLAYEQLVVSSRLALTAQEISATLAADTALNQLFQKARADGWLFFGNAYTVTLNTGDQYLDLVLLPADNNPAVVGVVRRAGEQRAFYRISPSSLAVSDMGGGFESFPDTQQRRFWGTWSASAPGAQAACGAAALAPQDTPPGTCKQDEATCLRNCLVKELGQDAIGILVPAFGNWRTFNACNACYLGGWGEGDCYSCAANLFEKLTGTAGPSVMWDVRQCMYNCNKSQSFREQQSCSQSETWCGTSQLAFSWPPMIEPVVRERVCDQSNCNWLWGENIKTHCGPTYGVCIQKPGVAPHCCDTRYDSECSCILAGTCGDHDHEIRTGHDPNALAGPAQVAPGQLVTYTAECENTGEGTAYGVYIAGTLAPELDESTLQLDNGGVYLPGTRMLLWNMGELGSRITRTVNFQARVRPDVVSGTVILQSAVVHFPSVPETTPTNDVVSQVFDVAAQPQELETTEGTPVAITLSGFAPSGNPLSFRITRQPDSGVLSGVAPNLVYTPGANFRGPDSLTFRASDGTSESAPADVSIVVRPGNDTTPPRVLAVSPAGGARDVWISLTPAYLNTFLPPVRVQFSEPLSAATVTTQTFWLADAQGRRLAGQVLYDAQQYAAQLALTEPLKRLAVYTATVTTGVRDTSGNPLAANYTWRFETEYFNVYLPLMLKK